MSSVWTLVIFFSAILSTYYCCEITRENVTWHFTNELDSFIPGVSDADDCFQLCLNESTCRGYTWQEDDLFEGVCLLFTQLTSPHDCHACYSGIKPEIVTTACNIDNPISFEKTATVDLCLENCINTTECGAYTWFNSNGFIKETCFLLADCLPGDCGDQCESGKLNCFTDGPTGDFYLLEQVRDFANFFSSTLSLRFRNYMFSK